MLDSLTIPRWPLYKVQNTGPKVRAGHHGASEAWGLRITRSQTWSVAIFSSVKWGSVINSKTWGSNVSETLGNPMLLGKEGVLVSMRTDADPSWGLEQESSASMQVGFSLEPSKRAPQVKDRKCPWFRLFSFKSLNFRMWLGHTENYYISLPWLLLNTHQCNTQRSCPSSAAQPNSGADMSCSKHVIARTCAQAPCLFYPTKWPWSDMSLGQSSSKISGMEKGLLYIIRHGRMEVNV